jgi:hypothetical protein
MLGGNTSHAGLSVCSVGLWRANVSLATALDSVENDTDQNDQENTGKGKTEGYQDNYSSWV